MELGKEYFGPLWSFVAINEGVRRGYTNGYSNENIFLNGFSCGFIGGASGVVDNTILFCGDIRKHKDYNNIKAFANNRGFDLYSLSNNDLYDYGGILPV